MASHSLDFFALRYRTYPSALAVFFHERTTVFPEIEEFTLVGAFGKMVYSQETVPVKEPSPETVTVAVPTFTLFV